MGLGCKLMSEGFLHISEKLFRVNDIAYLYGSGQHRGVREIPSECLFGDPSGVDCIYIALIPSEEAGVNPRIIEDKLKAYLPPKERLNIIDSHSVGSAVTDSE
jgi:hypothetical protein